MRPPPAALLCLILALGPGCPSGGDKSDAGSRPARERTPAGESSPASDDTRPASDDTRPASDGKRPNDGKRTSDGNRLAPIAAREAKSTHGPYGAGACETCHERHDAADPGRAVRASNQVCVGCHEEFGAGMAVRLDRSIHPVNDAPCTGCHNPHNARKSKLRM